MLKIERSINDQLRDWTGPEKLNKMLESPLLSACIAGLAQFLRSWKWCPRFALRAYGWALTLQECIRVSARLDNLLPISSSDNGLPVGFTPEDNHAKAMI
jgi:hypothetical protein